MTKFFDISGLRKYFKASCQKTVVPKREILGSTEALKQFGLLWGDYTKEVMTMLTVIEYEYIQDNVFSEKEIAAVKSVLGNIAVFLKDSKKEYDEFLDEQKRKKESI